MCGSPVVVESASPVPSSRSIASRRTRPERSAAPPRAGRGRPKRQLERLREPEEKGVEIIQGGAVQQRGLPAIVAAVGGDHGPHSGQEFRDGYTVDGQEFRAGGHDLAPVAPCHRGLADKGSVPENEQRHRKETVAVTRQTVGGHGQSRVTAADASHDRSRNLVELPGGHRSVDEALRLHE